MKSKMNIKMIDFRINRIIIKLYRYWHIQFDILKKTGMLECDVGTI